MEEVASDAQIPLVSRPPFEISRQDAGQATIVAVRGELDIAHAPKLGLALSEIVREHPALLVIDLCSVEFVDSTGLSVLLNIRRRSVRLGIELRLACDIPATLRLLALTKLDRDFDVYDTVAEAISGTRR